MPNCRPPEQTAANRRILVWDLPVRLVHWLIVVCFAVSWWSAENHEMEWHFRSGMMMLALVMFRLLWGLVGSTSARFSHFVTGPRRVLAYVRTLSHREASSHTGHNPLGGWSVVALMTALLLQVVLGLFAVDTDGLESGPLSWLVEFDTGRNAAQLHGVLFNVLLLLVAVHVAAVVFYLIYKGMNLIWPMIIGTKLADASESPVRGGSKIALIVAMALTAGLTFAVWSGLPFLG